LAGCYGTIGWIVIGSIPWSVGVDGTVGMDVMVGMEGIVGLDDMVGMNSMVGWRALLVGWSSWLDYMVG